MSNQLLFDPAAEGFASPLEIYRSRAVNATLGRLLCDIPDRPLETHYKSTNDTHGLWQVYAKQLGIRAKIEIPDLLPLQDKMRHPDLECISEWLGSVTLKTLKDETVNRINIYGSVLNHDFLGQIEVSDLEETRIQHRITRSCYELQSTESQYNPAVLAQIASTTLLNTTLRQHILEDNILSSQLQLTE